MYRGTLEVNLTRSMMGVQARKAGSLKDVAGGKDGRSPRYPLLRIGAQQPAGRRIHCWHGNHGLVQSG